ncbi:MAG: O-antigen ligase family protein [Nitrococcus sp.]|nr:O-antigen ligase family protein [Nitrococcus sp.]
MIYFLVLYSLTLPTLKIPLGFDIRLGQFVLLAAFSLILLRDMQLREVKWAPLLIMVGVGVIFSAISLLGYYPDIKETTFIVKWIAIYPPAFYVGLRCLRLVTPGQFIVLLESALLLSCIVAVILDAHPVPALIHERPGIPGLKGTFWEQAGLSVFIGVCLLGALGMRIKTNTWPQYRLWLLLLYGVAIGCAIATKNTTFWIAIFSAFVAAATTYRGDPILKDPWAIKVSRNTRRWAARFFVVAIGVAVLMTIYNVSLEPADKLITWEMLEYKWEAERGAALRSALSLIADDPILGKGFGFVEYYFSTRETDVLGLGEGSAIIFNSYLDIWVSVGILGPIYLVFLTGLSFSRYSIVSILLVTYLFVRANLNPLAQTEYYYIFLGLCFFLGGRDNNPSRSMLPS